MPLTRWAGLTALLLAEALGLGMRFEGVEATFAGHRWWSELLAQAHAFFDVFVLSAGAALLFGGAALADEFRRLSLRATSSRRGFLAFLLIHLAVFGGFAWLTAVVWEGGVESSPHAGRWAAAWGLVGALDVATLLAAALPLSFWLPIVRRCWPALLIGVLVGVGSWFMGQYTNALWSPFHRWTFQTVRALLSLILPDLVSEPSSFRLGAGAFVVTIHPTCSGYEGIGLIWVFVGAYLWHFRHEMKWPRALILLPIGTVLIWLVNAFRIAALVVIGVKMSRSVALGGFHSQGGWLAFLAVSLGLFLAARRMPYFRADSDLAEPADAPNPTVPYLAPLFALIAAMMITGAFSSGFDRFYPVRVLVASAVLWRYRDVYLAWRWPLGWEALFVGTGVFFLWIALEPRQTDALPSNLTLDALMTRPAWWSTGWVLFRIFGSVAVVPIAEELAFRGFLMRRLIAADFEKVPLGTFTWWSFLASSALFGMLHGRMLAGILAGLAYAWLVVRHKRLSDAIYAHALTNALIAASVLGLDWWTLWE